MPVSQVSDAPDSIKELAAKAGGDEKTKLSLSQVNWILERYDAMKDAEEAGDIDSAMAVAISQFRKAFEVKDGKWAEKPKEKTTGDVRVCSACGVEIPDEEEKCSECGEISEKVKPKEPEEPQEHNPEKKTKARDESYSDIENHVRSAWYEKFEPYEEAIKANTYVTAVFPSYVIVETPTGLMKYLYTEDAERNVTFGEPLPVERVYIPRPSKATIIKAFAKALYLSLVKKQNLPVWQDKDGVKWYTAVISTALVDEEKEIVTEAGMDFSIQLCRKYGIQPGLHIQHEVPETRIGDCLFEARVGPFWVELGQFRDTWLADKAFSALQKDEEGLWSISIGFLTPASQQRKGIYTKLLRFDSSVTDEPANLWTAIAVGGKTMQNMESIMRLLKLDVEDEAEQANLEKALEELLGKEAKSLAFVGKGPGGDELAAAMLRLESLDLDEATQAEVQEVLALLGQAGKVLLPTDVPEPAPAVEPDPDPEPDPEPPPPDPVSEVLTAIQGKLDIIVDRLTQVELAQQAVGAQAAITKALLQRLPKASIQRPTADAPEVPDANAAIAALQKELSNRSVAHPLAGMAGAPPAQGG